MASYFVSSASGAGGAGDGSSWANAYLTVSAALARPIAAGDTLLIGDDHSETGTTSLTLSFPGTVSAPNYLLVVDHTKSSPGPADLKIGAAGAGSIVRTTAGNIQMVGFIWVYGLYLNVGLGGSTASQILNLSVNGRVAYYERCTLGVSGTGTGNNMVVSAGTYADFRNCTFSFVNSANQGLAFPNASAKFIGCTFTFSGTQPTNLFPANDGQYATFEGCDFSAFSGTIVGINAAVYANKFIFKDCKMASGTPLSASGGVVNGQNQIWSIVSDSIASNTRNELYDYNATLTTALAVVRTGGASMGTAYAWKIVTTANMSWHHHFKTMAIAIWNTLTGAAVNVTLEGIADPRDFAALPNNDDIWFDVEALQNSAAPVGGYISGTKASPLASNSALSASTAAWDSAATARANSTAYSAGDIYKAASNPGRLFLCTTAGTSAGSEPGGIATAVDGGSVTDGTATFKAMWRFKQTITTGTIQFAGFISVYPKVGKASLNGIYLDPVATLS